MNITLYKWSPASRVAKGLTFVWVLTLGAPTHAGIEDMVKGYLGGTQTQDSAPPAAGAALTQTQMIDGVLEALSVGVERAVDYLGRDGGYLNDAAVRIPMPDTLATVEKGLRAVGQDKYADEFIATMNHAAERAVPKTTGILLDAIKGMKLTDAKDIVYGADNAATQYFREHTSDQLRQAMLPIVKQATDKVNLTSYYKAFLDKAGPLAGFINTQSLDLDRYVTDKALDGLFVKLAEQERLIRTDPVARSTELLQSVFGAVSGR